MRLTKRYFDIIDAQGRYLIAYDAVAHLGPAPLRYRATLSSDPALRCKALSLSGALTTADEFPQTLGLAQVAIRTEPRTPLQDIAIASGPIQWRLDAIGFHTSAGGVGGLGYCETVALTAPPWALSLRQVRWGRFIGTRHWAVWNHADGAHGFAFAASDGAPAPLTTHADRIEIGAARVELGAIIHVVGDGDVIAAELGALQPLIALLAGPRFRLIQHKAVRAARLISAASDQEEGFAMDETVILRA